MMAPHPEVMFGANVCKKVRRCEENKTNLEFHVLGDLLDQNLFILSLAKGRKASCVF